jgi:hypothetical protein
MFQGNMLSPSSRAEVTREVTEIELHPNNISRENGFSVGHGSLSFIT